MKTMLTLLILLITWGRLCSQSLILSDSSGTWQASGVVQIDSADKAKLYSQALGWISLAYESAKGAIQLSDAAAGIIIVKGAWETNIYLKPGYIKHTLTLEFKDNRYRYAYSNLSYYSSGSGEMSFDRGSFISKKTAIKSAQQKMDASMKSLAGYIRQKITTSDDW